MSAFVVLQGAVINATADPSIEVTARTDVTTAGESFMEAETGTSSKSRPRVVSPTTHLDFRPVSIYLPTVKSDEK